MKCCFLLLVFLLFFPSSLFSQILLNEVYYDHPGSDAGHEFIELIGVGSSPLALNGLTIEFHDGASGAWRLIWAGSVADTLRFEQLFVIGGALVRPAADHVATLNLQNGPDGVRLLRDGIAVDVLGYGDVPSPDGYEGEPAQDVEEGMSLARWPDGADNDDNASDFRPAQPSPGAFNRPRHDIALALVESTPLRAIIVPGDRESLRVRVVNEGIHRVDQPLWVTAVDSTHNGPVTLDSSRVDLRLEPGEGTRVDIEVAPGFGYHDIAIAVRVEDERPRNNRLVLYRRVGGPRIIVSEVMSHPADGCPEYIELFNDDSVAYALSGFAIRDAARDLLVLNTDVVMPPGGWVVLTPDKLALLQCFPQTDAGRVGEIASGWPSLNHSGSGEADSVIVADPMRLAVDRIAYPGQPTDSRGRSLERVDLYYSIGPHTWVLTDAPAGGTPAAQNTRTVADPGEARAVRVDPNPFDPYRDERLIVSVSDVAGGAEAAVFDLAGSRVASVGVTSNLPFVFVWDGRDDDGRLVAPGHYILACVFERNRIEKVVIACARRR